MSSPVALVAGPPLALHPQTPPAVSPGWLRLRVHVAGVCRTDLSVASGVITVPTGLVLGHEATGTVEATAPGDQEWLGRRVAVNPWFGAGQAGVAEHGAFATWWRVPVSAVIAVPDHWEHQRAAFLEPVAAALAPLAWLPPDTPVAVGGVGRIAALTRRVLALGGVDLCDDGPVSAAVETHPSAVAALVQRLQPGGLLVLKSRPGTPAPLPWDAIVRKQIRLQGAWYGDFLAAVDLLDELAVDDLFGATHPLSDFAAAFAIAATEGRKVFLDPSC